MILQTAMPVVATVDQCGEVADLVVDPTTWKVTQFDSVHGPSENSVLWRQF
jgi:hypothetical protein